MIGPTEFADYIAAFNRGDTSGYSKYYAEDVTFTGPGRNLVGRDAIINFYRAAHQRMKQTVTVRHAYFGEDGMAADLDTELVFLEDWPDFFNGPMKAGDIRRTFNFAFYEVKAGLFTRIRTANFSSFKSAAPAQTRPESS